MQHRHRARFWLAVMLAASPLTIGAASAADVSLDAAVAAAQERHKARVVKAEVSESAGRTVYSLRLLGGDGRVWTIRIDASTGLELNP
jgi:uncharacterized membrane protein YkoI